MVCLKENCVKSFESFLFFFSSKLSVNSGHYTSLAWHDGKWYNFNDSSVLPSDEKHVESVKGYIFFYTKAKPDNSIIEKLKPLS